MMDWRTSWCDRDLLARHEIVCSMSAKGCCWANAVVESFLSTLKLELDLDDNREVLLVPLQLQRDLARRIDDDGNGERRHSTIGWPSPIDHEVRSTAAYIVTPAETRSVFTKSGEPQEAVCPALVSVLR